MQTTENYSDRRRNIRKHDERRNNLRLKRSFDVSLLDHSGKTVNVSGRGVYLELATNNFEVFPTGTSILLQINVATNTSDGREKKFLLFGRGTVIRNCIIEDQDHTNSLGVALKFTEQLNSEFDND